MDVDNAVGPARWWGGFEMVAELVPRTLLLKLADWSKLSKLGSNFTVAATPMKLPDCPISLGLPCWYNSNGKVASDCETETGMGGMDDGGGEDEVEVVGDWDPRDCDLELDLDVGLGLRSGGTSDIRVRRCTS